MADPNWPGSKNFDPESSLVLILFLFGNVFTGILAWHSFAYPPSSIPFSAFILTLPSITPTLIMLHTVKEKFSYLWFTFPLHKKSTGVHFDQTVQLNFTILSKIQFFPLSKSCYNKIIVELPQSRDHKKCQLEALQEHQFAIENLSVLNTFFKTSSSS